MLTKRRFITLCAAALLMSGCVSDKLDGLCPPDNRVRIALAIGDRTVVETRSVASTQERTIDDAYVLIFGADGKYVDQERVAIATNISDNGSQTPVLTTNFVPIVGQKVVVLVNTGKADGFVLPLTVGVSTTADINAALGSYSIFTAWDPNGEDNAQSGRRMPMSGETVWSASDNTINMYRSVAKLQLRVDNNLQGVFAAPFQQAATDDLVEWSVGNQMCEAGYLYSANGATIYPTDAYSTDPANSMLSWTGRTSGYGAPVGSSDTNPRNKVLYLPEYPYSTKAGSVTLDPMVWNAQRMCMIVIVGGNRYYRIDLYDHVTKRYLDFKRNYHYIVHITKVNSEGYTSSTEAFANPSSNLEYSIVVTDERDDSTLSNGQYAVATDRAEVEILSSNISREVMDFSLLTSGEAPINLTTAYVDIVGSDKTTIVDFPNSISVDGRRPTVGGDGNKYIALGNQTAANRFTLVSDALGEEREAYEALNGCYVRIHMGNITKYVPIVVNKLSGAWYYGTANCVQATTTTESLSFDVTPYRTTSPTYAYQDNIDRSLAEPRSAALLWSDVSATHLTNISVTSQPDGKYTLACTSSKIPGNSVVAIYNTDDPTDPNAVILWSFHVWVSDRTSDSDQTWSVINIPDRTIVPNVYTMMDRNLGATSNAIASSTDDSSYGLYYQWGRKDPFVGGSGPRANKTKKTIYGQVTSQPVVITTADIGTIVYATRNPTTFIGHDGGSTSMDWLFAARDHSLWGNPNPATSVNVYPQSVGNKSIYDPCPAGYCVPPQDAFTMILKAQSIVVNNGINASGSGWNCVGGGTGHIAANYGIRIYCQQQGTGEVAYLPCAGELHRINGEYQDAGGQGMYCTNTNMGQTQNNSARASFNNTTWNPIWSSARSMGQSVRCCKEM